MATVEEPQSAIFIAVDENDPHKKNNAPGRADVIEVEPVPITNSLRTTVAHLRARAGRWSRFRGFGIYMVWSVAREFFTNAFSLGAHPSAVIPRGLARIVAEVALSGLVLTWIHTVISEPQATSWWRRFPAYRTWSKFAPAVALKAVAGQVGFVVPVLLGCALHLFRIDDEFISVTDPNKLPRPTPALLGGGIAVFVLSLALVVFVEIPAHVIMVRVAASLLPDNVDSIVPFDRSFGGKVTPAVVGGAGKLGLMDAWKTFTYSGRVRLMKVLLKVGGMAMALGFTFGLIYASIIIYGK